MEQLIQTLGDDLPTAFFMASDALAVGALRSLQEHQIAIPDRVSLISFNDTSIAKVCLSLPLYSDRLHGRNGQASHSNAATNLSRDLNQVFPIWSN